MKIIHTLFTLLALAVVSATIQACSDEAQANNPPATADGPTQDEFDELVARVEQLEQSINTVVSRDSTSGSTSQKLTMAAGAPVGCTFSGHIPQDQLHARTIQCKSPNGVLYNLPTEGGAPDLIQNVYFETVDCSGQAMVQAEFFSESALTQGVVFSYKDTIGTHVGYIGSPDSVSRNVQSFLQASNGECYPITESGDYITIGDNDPAVTGVENTYPATLIQ